MIPKLGWRMDEHSEDLNKESETIRKKIRSEEYNNCNGKYTGGNQL